MIILALESSAKSASAALCADGQLLGQSFQNNGLTHSRTLLAMTESLISNLGVRMSDINLVAVSSGPGSFTGVRIGVSAAKGLALGLGIPVCGVSTLEAMAYQITEPGILICPVMDARRSQVYNALFMWEDGSLKRLCSDRAISLQDLADELRSSVTPDSLGKGRPTLLIGDGDDLSYGFLSVAGVRVETAPQLLRYQTAYGVALAAINAKHVPAADLEPSYLRPSQAERIHTACSHSS